MFIKSTLVGLTVVAFAAAQSGGTSSNSTIDPNSVDATTRSNWCISEIATCGTLCDGEYDSNTCDTTTLNYTCTCSSNGSAPGLQYYTNSMPTFICEQIYQNCIIAGQNVAAAQKVCNENELANCGHLNPANYTAAATTSASSSSASATATATSSGTASSVSSSAAAATSSNAAAVSMNIGREYGTGIFVAGVGAVFGLML
ncbi:pci domain-containing protein [Rutstroemia sp. NJR-2017a WRK4]|nr:pci domain-containing protein [Rutstroemia sp. NJR-2017a WRK4]PQE14833.1 pci domain-containing protein [Rutstroemia sp. NJR-2017a WRK4]